MQKSGIQRVLCVTLLRSLLKGMHVSLFKMKNMSMKKIKCVISSPNTIAEIMTVFQITFQAFPFTAIG